MEGGVTVDVDAFINGCEAALEELINEMRAPLMKYSYSILLNHADAEDAVQTAFIKIYQNRKHIRSINNLSAYLNRVTYNASVDIIRINRFIVREPQSQNSINSYISEEMQKALGKLTALDRALVYGRAVDELSYNELSEIHGRSEQSLRKRYERAKKKLVGLLNLNKQKETLIINNNREVKLI